jgi:tol-pal system protein YbgF
LTTFSDTRHGLLLLAVALLVTGCATRASYQRLTADVAALRGEVTDLRQAQDAAGRDVARTAGEARALEARIGEVTAAQAVSTSELSTLRERVEKAESGLREARAHAAAATPPPSPAPPAATPPAPRAAAPTPPAARAATPAPAGAQQAYQAAMATFRAREYGQAVLDFVDFMAKYPGHPLVANAQYWIGEAYYVQRDYRQAMTEFQKVLDVAPASPKVPDALLKIGLCYRNLRDESRARQTWDRVAKDYPKSQAATHAQALMRGKAAAAAR